MNKHTICEDSLAEFLQSFATLQECLAKCGEIIVKTRFCVGYYWYRAKVWSEHKKGDEK